MFLYNLFIQIWLILNLLATLFCLYQFVISIAGLHKDEKFPENKKKNRFAAIIAARNEENVIGNLIESLKLQDYPSDLLDIIVIADNCTDNTAEAAERAGAIVYKRFNKAEVGKGYVLTFAFEKIFAERDKYDAFCVFDADNVVDKHFISEMNNAMGAGFEVAQGNRDMKNAADSWVSGCHALFFWMENSFFNSARAHLSLPASVNGTGFMVSASLLKEIGYHVFTCTEDIEFTLQSCIAGRRVGWAPYAIVYDEQPVTLSQSTTQRIRWIKGFMQCCRRYTVPLFKRLYKKPDWVALDTCIYVTGLPVMIAGLLAGFMSFIFTVLRIFDPLCSAVSMTLLTLGGLLGCWLIAVLTLILQKKLHKNMVKAVLTYPIFNLLWIFIYIYCFFKKNVEWTPITHARSISINELESKAK